MDGRELDRQQAGRLDRIADQLIGSLNGRSEGGVQRGVRQGAVPAGDDIAAEIDQRRGNADDDRQQVLPRLQLPVERDGRCGDRCRA